MDPRPAPNIETPLPLLFLEAKLDEWVEAFPVEAIRQQLAELESRKGTIEAAIESLNRRLQIWQAMRARENGHQDLVPTPSKRDAVLNLLEQDPTRDFSLAEIRGRLTECGLLESNPKARHALEMTVSNMAKRREIERVRKGYYRIAAPLHEQAAPLTDLRCKEGDAT